ncbi:MAG: DUF697 domain-containing protein [Deltaproteobacteria bacterium]|nr:DUF697 domain-containing protein [Deltaproteobacteria bacterium]
MTSYMDTLKKVLEGGYDNADDATKTAAVRDLIQVCSIASGAVAIQPIPFLDVALISPIQIGLVQGIGRIHGQKLDKKSVLEILSTFGASLVAQNVILAAAKFVPFFGWVVGPAMAYALTYAVGEVSDFYFRSGRGVAAEDLRSMFQKVYKEKRAEKEAANKDNATLKDKLAQLNDAFKSGLLTDEEFNRKKEELLRSF